MAIIDRIRSLLGGGGSGTDAATLSTVAAEGAGPADLLSANVASGIVSLPGCVQLAVVDPTVAGFDSQYTEPILQMTQRLPGMGALHDTQMLLWHAMRQYSPTLDAAIRNRRTLEGMAVVTSEDEGLASVLNDVMKTLPVGYLGGVATLEGVNTYAAMMADNADEYGLSAGEILTDERGREIRRLVAPNVRTLSIRDDDRDGIYNLYQSQRGTPRRIDDHPLVQVLSLSYATEGPWPCPLAWSAVKSTEAVMRMFEAVINGWWRFGDPSLLTGFAFDKEATPDTVEITLSDGTKTTVPASLVLLKDSVEAIMQARRKGQVGDAYVSAHGGTLINEVLGEIDAGLMRYFREHASLFDSHIVALSRTPIWMYPSLTPGRSQGLGGTLADNEARVASVDARWRNGEKAKIIRQVLDTWLLLSGDARFIGRFQMEFESASILDDKLVADTRLADANADSQHIENAAQLFNEDGTPRFVGEAERYLQQQGVLPED